MATLARPPARGPASAASRTSRTWWHVHQWAGLKLSLFLSFIFLTGTLATLSPEIDWLLHPTLRVAPASVKGPVAWDRIAREADRHPGVRQILSIDEPTARAFAAKVMIVRDDGRYAWLHAHPSSGAIQGEGHWVNAARILRNMHRHLNLPTKIGVPIVSALAFLMLVSLATSLVVYKKWWRGFFKPVRWRDARTAWGDFHRFAGLWSLWFAALIALTSVWYFLESVGLDAPSPPQARVQATGVPPAEPGQAVASGLAAVRAADPELDIETVVFPDEDAGAFVFQGQRDAILVRPRANAVWTDAAGGAVLLVADARRMSLHQRIAEAADPLHFGTFGGYWTRIAWFVFGVLLTAMSVSGVMIFAHRIARERGPSFRSYWRGSWAGMARWRWLSVVLIATGFALLPCLFFQAAG